MSAAVAVCIGSIRSSRNNQGVRRIVDSKATQHEQLMTKRESFGLTFRDVLLPWSNGLTKRIFTGMHAVSENVQTSAFIFGCESSKANKGRGNKALSGEASIYYYLQNVEWDVTFGTDGKVREKERKNDVHLIPKLDFRDLGPRSPWMQGWWGWEEEVVFEPSADKSKEKVWASLSHKLVPCDKISYLSNNDAPW